MLPKSSKVRILENFHALDYALLGKLVSETKVCCPFLIEEYNAAKLALMSIVTEIYKFIGHNPTPITESVSKERLKVYAQETAQTARKNAKILLNSKEFKEKVVSSLQESVKTTKNIDMNKLIDEELELKATSSMLDDMLLRRALKESTDAKKLTDSWKGKVLKGSYDNIRESLIDAARSILES